MSANELAHVRRTEKVVIELIKDAVIAMQIEAKKDEIVYDNAD